MRGAVKIEGMADLNANFASMGKGLTRNALKRVGIKALKDEFVPVAATLAPDDPATGGKDLKASITASDRLNPRQKSLNKTREDKSFAEVYAGPTVPHGLFQEFGTATNSPQPFMRPAWDQTWRAILDNVAKGLWPEVLKTIARKAKRDAAKAAKAGQ